MKILLELGLRALPPLILFLATWFADYTDTIQVKAETYILSTILGFCITIWATQIGMKGKIERSMQLASPDFEVFDSDEEKLNEVKSLYSSTSATIYSTNIYSKYDVPTGRKDLAFPLYGRSGANNKFIRIVSVNTEEHKKWVQDMMTTSKNCNYELFVIEGIAESLLFPNFVILKSKNRTKLFMSFRSDGVSGNFSFATSNSIFVNGLLDYIAMLTRKSETAEKAIQRWQQGGAKE